MDGRTYRQTDGTGIDPRSVAFVIAAAAAAWWLLEYDPGPG